MWGFTIFTVLVMGAFTLMGGGYLPWYISSIGTAIIADLIASKSSETSIPKLAVVGIYLGYLILKKHLEKMKK